MNWRSLLPILAVAALAGAPVQAGEPTPPVSTFCLDGCPTGAKADDTVLAHHIYALSNNPRTKFADWVAYLVTADKINPGCKRVWTTDLDLDPATTLAPKDYAGANKALHVDRGHQAPLASLCDAKYWPEADYLSNITPQSSALNQGPWERLESAERGIVKGGISATVYTLTGPLYERKMPALPHASKPHKIPSGYWKIVAVEKDGAVHAAGFVMNQDLPRDADYCATHVTLSAIEARAHLHFFPKLAQLPAEGAMIENLGCAIKN
jgi:endonuclease G